MVGPRGTESHLRMRRFGRDGETSWCSIGSVCGPHRPRHADGLSTRAPHGITLLSAYLALRGCGFALASTDPLWCADEVGGAALHRERWPRQVS